MSTEAVSGSAPPVTLPEHARILLVSLRRIGDVLLTTPLIRSLRRAWPDATIDVLVFKGTTGIVAGNPDIDDIIVMPARPSFGQTMKLAARLWKRYNLAISTQTGDRPTFFALAAGRRHAGLVALDGPPIARAIKRRLLGRSTPAIPNLHRVEQMLRLADTLGIARIAELVCPAAAPPGFEFGENFAVIHAAPMFRYKEWTCAGWRALANGLKARGLEIVAIGGPGETEQRYLADVWQGIARVHQTGWPETTWLLERARVYIGPDTSVTHLAAAAGCPTVALFGPMDPRVWGPFPVGGLKQPWDASGAIQRRGNVVLVQNPLPCLPCTFEGCERHIGSHSACLDELKPEQVLEAVDRALA
ncbi:MAG TPA: glycosyltransferase family 9 protein [Pseudolabrys sp.]|nr:glycosyltransferase family 9 protein [Pseudolabrys sp.]